MRNICCLQPLKSEDLLFFLCLLQVQTEYVLDCWQFEDVTLGFQNLWVEFFRILKTIYRKKKKDCTINGNN